MKWPCKIGRHQPNAYSAIPCLRAEMLHYSIQACDLKK
jgi:hypothetical protein